MSFYNGFTSPIQSFPSMFRTIGEGMLEIEPEHRFQSSLSPMNQIGQNLGAATCLGVSAYSLARSATSYLGQTVINYGSRYLLKNVVNEYSENSSIGLIVRENSIAKPRLNKLSPHPEAIGPHSSFKWNSINKRINGYETYEKNLITGNWAPVVRFRGSGRSHGGIEPPLILERPFNKRPGATPNISRKPNFKELPNGS